MGFVQTVLTALRNYGVPVFRGAVVLTIVGGISFSMAANVGAQEPQDTPPPPVIEEEIPPPPSISEDEGEWISILPPSPPLPVSPLVSLEGQEHLYWVTEVVFEYHPSCYSTSWHYGDADMILTHDSPFWLPGNLYHDATQQAIGSAMLNSDEIFYEGVRWIDVRAELRAVDFNASWSGVSTAAMPGREITSYLFYKSNDIRNWTERFNLMGISQVAALTVYVDFYGVDYPVYEGCEWDPMAELENAPRMTPDSN